MPLRARQHARIFLLAVPEPSQGQIHTPLSFFFARLLRSHRHVAVVMLNCAETSKDEEETAYKY